ncbi:hypothetical protein PVAP13_5KG011700 [Panicum virgatum]|uniref:Uncharacterized protein n=1 Tax=Panicum virgatum TaxID=38727 RepID=A0A8T0S8W2_PANVG|nr:hypothetical protein PVAP13_5KG011700 [Panicum virgatum]
MVFSGGRASSSCDWDCRHLPGNGNAAMGTAVALHPLASVSANFLDGTSWCFQEGAALSQVSTLMATSKQPSLGAWRTVQPWFDLVGYGASMRLSLAGQPNKGCTNFELLIEANRR